MKILPFVASLLVLASTACTAATVSVETTLLTHLQSTYPKHNIREVVTSPVPNLFHVVMGSDVATLAVMPETLQALKDEKKLEPGISTRYWLMGGRFFDSEKALDLKADIKSKAERIDVRTLNLKDAIVEVKGNPKETLYVFTDPLCPFCQRLHVTLKALTDIKIVTFLTPLKTLHPQSEEVAARIACSKQPTLALDWAFRDLEDFLKRTKPATCDTPIARNLDAMKTLYIKGTPTLFLTNGERLVGYQSAQAIQKALQNQKKHEKEAL